MAQRLIPGSGYVDEAGSAQRLAPGVGYIHETSGSTPVTINGLVGNATADGSTAAVYQGTTIQALVGNAVADGNNATVTNSGTTTISCFVGDATAAGALAAVYQGVTILAFAGNAVANGSNAAITNNGTTTISGIVGNAVAAGSTANVTNIASGSFQTDFITNNNGTPWALQPVVWTWFPAGRLGSMSLVTALDGTGTTASDGRLTATGIPAGAGILMVAVRNASVALDDVYYETGTVA